MPAVILLVEADAYIRKLVRGYLAGQGYEVLEAADRDDAVRCLKRSRPIDILLTDTALPEAGEAATVVPITGQQGAIAEVAKEIVKETLLAEPFQRLDLLTSIGNRLGRWAVDRNPILSRAHGYWLSKSAGRNAPDRSELDPRELVDILPYLSIVEIAGGGDAPRHRYRLAGTRVAEGLGYDPTNSIVEESVEGAALLRRLLADVARAQRPSYAASPLRSESDGRSTERLFLPFRLSGNSIRQIVIAQTFDWRGRKTSVHDLAPELGARSDGAKRARDESSPAAKRPARPYVRDLPGWWHHQPLP